MRLSATALRELGAGRPLVLGIDDAQLLDASSTALVLELTLSQAAFVVMTVRSGEPVPDAIVSVWKDAGATRLERDTLGPQQTGALARRSSADRSRSRRCDGSTRPASATRCACVSCYWAR